jgi:hypothetical protein
MKYLTKPKLNLLAGLAISNPHKGVDFRALSNAQIARHRLKHFATIFYAGCKYIPHPFLRGLQVQPASVNCRAIPTGAQGFESSWSVSERELEALPRLAGV